MERSKIEFLAAVTGTLYSIYLVRYFYDAADANLSGSLATFIVTPHMLFCVLGSIFAWVAFFGNGRGMALAAAIMFCVAAVVFVAYAPLTVPMILLCFIGYAMIGRINRKDTYSL